MVETLTLAPGRLQLPCELKARTRVLLLAKHARSGGKPDASDGNHALYHHELRTTLEAVGFDVSAAESYEALFTRPNADFVIPLLNRGGFQNSEMLAPLLLSRLNLPFLGASPIIRGLADDKHLTKVVARRLGVPTAEWASYRIGAHLAHEPPFRAERYVVKPNASSASWGVAITGDWEEARRHIGRLHAQSHDALVEPWTPLIDIAVPVIGARGAWLLPPMAYQPEEAGSFRSYEEKRGLVPSGDDPIEPIADPAVAGRAHDMTLALMRELWPFDYGRFEFRFDPARGDLSFMEVNLSCNLWSKKTISRSAALAGMDHAALVETIMAHSLARQGLLNPDSLRVAA
jgi:D-alanine-D-alanine ligase